MELADVTPQLPEGDIRSRQLDEIAEALPQRAAALSRLFLTRTSTCLSRTEVGVMRVLSTGPRRITELACHEQVTQPAITLLVNRMAERGWVQRVADPSDGRAVLVSLTILLFIRDWRTTLIATVAIPTSMVGTL